MSFRKILRLYSRVIRNRHFLQKKKATVDIRVLGPKMTNMLNCRALPCRYTKRKFPLQYLNILILRKQRQTVHKREVVDKGDIQIDKLTRQVNAEKRKDKNAIYTT